MTLYWLIEANVAVPNAGEPHRDVHLFASRLVREFQTKYPGSTVSLQFLGPDKAVVDVDALLRLQTKANLK